MLLTSDGKPPVAINWLHPGQASLVTRVPAHAPPPGNPIPVEPGALLRCGDKLGIVLEQRELEDIPIAVKSVAVSCTISLGRFPKLDLGQINVWSLGCSQVLTGKLLEAAEKDPEGTLLRFMQIDERFQEQEREKRKACLPKKMKQPPGKK